MYKTISVVLLLCCLFPKKATANLEQNMQEFWNSINSSVSSNSATAFQGQTAGYYSLGSMQMRNTQMSVQPVDIQLPSLRAGCGGIDLFSGSFSFINSSQLIALLKSIASNSIGYAFNLAMETLSPMIANNISKLQNVVDKVNQFNINSCELASTMVDGAVSYLQNAGKLSCEGTANSKGISSDAISARNECMQDSRRSSINNQADEKTRPVNINLVWKALRDNGYVGAFGTETAEVFMNITGTIIVIEDSSGIKINRLNPLLKNDDFIKGLLEGGNLQIYACQETTNCLQTVTRNLYIKPAKSFLKQVENLLTGIELKLRNEKNGGDASLTTAEKQLIQLLRFPAFRILQTSVATSGMGAGTFNAHNLAEVAALEILNNYAEQVLDIVSNSLRSLLTYNTPDIQQIINNTIDLRRYLEVQGEKSRAYVEQVIRYIEANQEFEKVLSGDFANRMGAVIRFSNSLQ